MISCVANPCTIACRGVTRARVRQLRDRALKRLALQRVRDIDLWKAALVRLGEPVAQARAKLADADLPIAMLVDDETEVKLIPLHLPQDVLEPRGVDDVLRLL